MYYDWRDAARTVYRDGSYGNGAVIIAVAAGWMLSRQQPDQILDVVNSH